MGRKRRAGWAAACVALAVACTGGPSPGRFSVEHPVTTGTGSGLVSVSCPVDGSCVAVGRRRPAPELPAPVPVAERWHDGTWTALPAPPVAAGMAVELVTVSCATATACVVVGRSTPDPEVSAPGGTPYVARWDGARWTDESSLVPAVPGLQGLTDVSCRPAGNAVSCLAVGTLPLSTGSMSAAFVSRGDGWKAVPAPPGSQSNIGGVSGRRSLQIDCATPTSCVSASLVIFDFLAVTYVSYWNGVAWSAPTTTNGGILAGAEIGGVACAAAGRCLATGTNGRVLGWTGASWIQTGTAAGGPVACASADLCLVLPGPDPATTLAGSFAHQSSAWHPVTSAPPGPLPDDGKLVDVSCAGTRCVAVGADSSGAIARLWTF